MKTKAKDKKICANIGGQAVMEGVMMKSSTFMSTSVRKKDGKIVTKNEKLKPHKNTFINKISKAPFIRGVFNLIEILIIGIRTLIWSANISLEEEEEQITNKEIFWLLFTSLGLAVLLFVALPYFATGFLGINETKSPILFNLVDGMIKILLFVTYIAVISLMPDIKRLFQYHGAEHKSVHCYEHGLPLTIANVKKFTTKHPRCGTSFMMIVLIVSIFVFTLLPVLAKAFYVDFTALNGIVQKLILFPIRILFIPIIAGISYEILKFGAKYDKNPIMKVLVLPGVLVQYLSTKEPDNKQIEVAIKSLKEVLKAEKIKC